MKRILAVFLIYLCNFVNLQEIGTGSGTNGNLRLCIVEGRGGYKRGAKYCPILDDEKSGIECVIGADRLDCLRRISKGTVDFGVFSPEDLIAAKWANIDVLVTNELKLKPKPYQRSVVAVVNKRILPTTSWSLEAVLRNTSLCHPGNEVHDLRPLSDTLAGYLESLIITRSCEQDLSLTENRIKAMATFFNRACKAGAWVPEVARDQELKKRYPSLCAACQGRTCSANDHYRGSSGALSCLVEGAGDVMWGELDDVITYFGLNDKSKAYVSPENFVYLCRDGSSQTLTNNTEPCVWLNIPWKIVVAKRKSSAAVGTLISSLKNNAMLDGQWRNALTALLEIREAPTLLDPPRAPIDHLTTARGFQEAFSQSGCNPPRHISVCTTSLIEKNKCEWMSEAAAVYGITPPLQCSVASNTTECLRQVQSGESHVTMLESDWLMPAIRDYKLEPILYEATPIAEKMDTVFAYVKKDAMLNSMEDLRGKRAAFPLFDGVAWHSFIRYFKEKEKKSCGQVVNYFSDICAPGIELHNVGAEIQNKFTKSCYMKDKLSVTGEKAALRSLLEGKSDVAFISLKTVKMYQTKQILESWASVGVEIVPVCPEENKKYCFISWSNVGHVYTKNNLTEMRKNEITTVFTKLDQLFGNSTPFNSPMFTMYGRYSNKSNVLFHDITKNLATRNDFGMHPYDKMPFNFDRNLQNFTTDSCQIQDIFVNSAYNIRPSLLIIFSLVYLFIC